MWRKLLSKNIIPYTITILVLLADFAIVFMVTMWTPDFTMEALRTSAFWLQLALKTIVSLIAYLVFVYFSSTVANRSRDMEILRYQIMLNYDFVITSMLTDYRDLFIDIRNNIEKAKAYLVHLDKKLERIKDYTKDGKRKRRTDSKRIKINAEKKLLAEFMEQEQARLSGKAVTEAEQKALAERFNINAVIKYFMVYFKIEKRLLDGSNAYRTGRVLGYFNKGKHVFGDILYKLVPTMFFAMLISIIVPGLFTKEAAAIQAAIYLSLLVLMNCLFGWLEGNTIVNKYERSALNEIKMFYGDFFNFCVVKNVIDGKAVAAANTMHEQDIKEHFKVDCKNTKNNG